MATLLDRPPIETRPAAQADEPTRRDRSSAPIVAGAPGLPAELAPVELEPAEEAAGVEAPWLRIILIGVLVGVLIGLPVLPNAERIVAAYGEFAVAYGLPCHAPPTTGR